MNAVTLATFKSAPWCTTSLARNKSFSFDWVDAAPDLSWDWNQLSRLDPDLPFVKRYITKPWNWTYVSMSIHISFTEMVENRDIPWVIEEVLFSEITDDDITYIRVFRDRYDFSAWIDHSLRAHWSVVKKTPDLPWVYFNVNPEIETQEDIDFIIEHDPALWNWVVLSSTTPIHIILDNMELPWDWNIISSNNASVSFNNVINHPEVPWNYAMVPPEIFDDVFARRWIAASHIKRMFKKSISDPNYKLCKKRLIKEFGDLKI